MYRVGIDIGGTKVNMGVINEAGTILGRRIFASGDAKDAPKFVDRLCTELLELLREQEITMADVAHIGAGIPGTADSERGMVEFSCNLFGDKEVPLADLIEARVGLRPAIVQDSWAAAYAEYRFGFEESKPNMLCVTIGTGVGCGVILGGHVFAGAMHTAGEIGHTSVEWNGRPCNCGRRGCLERYVSGNAILEQALERFPAKLSMPQPSTRDVFALAYEGDADALALIDDCTDKLAYGLAMMVNILSTDTVVVSGGVCEHKALYIDPLREKMLAYGYPSWTRKRRIAVERARLGSDAPMVGAAFLTAKEMR